MIRLPTGAFRHARRCHAQRPPQGEPRRAEQDGHPVRRNPSRKTTRTLGNTPAAPNGTQPPPGVRNRKRKQGNPAQDGESSGRAPRSPPPQNARIHPPSQHGGAGDRRKIRCRTRSTRHTQTDAEQAVVSETDLHPHATSHPQHANTAHNKTIPRPIAPEIASCMCRRGGVVRHLQTRRGKPARYRSADGHRSPKAVPRNYKVACRESRVHTSKGWRATVNSSSVIWGSAGGANRAEAGARLWHAIEFPTPSGSP